MKKTYDQVLHWVMETYLRIGHLLYRDCIPYEIGMMDVNPNYPEMIRMQYKFPWCDGDVVVGMLHSRDLDYIYGTVEPPEIPSIETYKFPWDEGDITVFDDPYEFVATLNDYYRSLPDMEAVRG